MLQFFTDMTTTAPHHIPIVHAAGLRGRGSQRLATSALLRKAKQNSEHVIVAFRGVPDALISFSDFKASDSELNDQIVKLTALGYYRTFRDFGAVYSEVVRCAEAAPWHHLALTYGHHHHPVALMSLIPPDAPGVAGSDTERILEVMLERRKRLRRLQTSKKMAKASGL